MTSYAEHVRLCDRTGARLTPAAMDAMAGVFGAVAGEDACRLCGGFHGHHEPGCPNGKTTP
jgi:hypothetical protein